MNNDFVFPWIIRQTTKCSATNFPAIQYYHTKGHIHATFRCTFVESPNINHMCAFNDVQLNTTWLLNMLVGFQHFKLPCL